ncbi:MAG: response regulator [Chloroflexales bacterium]|nr:response regulator [Chloroflexales bacterium]
MGIIIASNNLFRLELSAYLLSEAGHTVHEIDSGDALLHALEHHSPCLIVLDSQLDRETPRSLLGLLLQRASAPVLVLGGLHPTDLQALRAQGGDAISWPYQNDDLVARAQALKLAARAIASA